MEIFVHACNYASTDDKTQATQFETDYAELVNVRTYLQRSGEIPVMIRKLRASLAHRFASTCVGSDYCHCGQPKTWPYHT